MSLSDKLKTDIKEAMKAGDSDRLLTLRMILAAFQNREIEGHAKGIDSLDDKTAVDVLRKEAKKRKEAAEIYGKADRHDLEEKELKELGIIQGYLPAEMDEAEIEKIVKRIMTGGAKDIGAVMKEAMKEISGKAEAGRVSAVVKKLL